MTSSAPSSGITVLAPFPNAVATVVDARNTSTIATSLPAVSDGLTWIGEKKTSSRICRLLHQLGLALEELRIHLPILESLVRHHSTEEWNGSGDTFDDEALERD